MAMILSMYERMVKMNEPYYTGFDDGDDHYGFMPALAVSMGVWDDDIISACLALEAVRYGGKCPDELPVSDRVRRLVELAYLDTEDVWEECLEDTLREYCEEIVREPEAALVRCMDICFELHVLAWEKSTGRIRKRIEEIEWYYRDLLEAVRLYDMDTATLLQYHLTSMLAVHERSVYLQKRMTVKPRFATMTAEEKRKYAVQVVWEKSRCSEKWKELRNSLLYMIGEATEDSRCMDGVEYLITESDPLPSVAWTMATRY